MFVFVYIQQPWPSPVTLRSSIYLEVTVSGQHTNTTGGHPGSTHYHQVKNTIEITSRAKTGQLQQQGLPTIWLFGRIIKCWRYKFGSCHVVHDENAKHFN